MVEKRVFHQNPLGSFFSGLFVAFRFFFLLCIDNNICASDSWAQEVGSSWGPRPEARAKNHLPDFFSSDFDHFTWEIEKNQEKI